MFKFALPEIIICNYCKDEHVSMHDCAIFICHQQRQSNELIPGKFSVEEKFKRKFNNLSPMI